MVHLGVRPGQRGDVFECSFFKLWSGDDDVAVAGGDVDTRGRFKEVVAVRSAARSGEDEGLGCQGRVVICDDRWRGSR